MRMIRACLLAGLLLFVAGALRADIIYLKNGREVEGTIVHREADQIVVAVADSASVIIKTADIDRIEAGNAQVSPTGKIESAAEALQLAKEAAAKGDFSKARGLFERALQLEPGNAEAQSALEQTVLEELIFEIAYPEKARNARVQKIVDNAKTSLPLVEKHLDAAIKKFADWATKEKAGQLFQTLTKQWEKRRKAALDFIRDESKYETVLDRNGNIQENRGQAEVNQLATDLRTLYERSDDVTFLCLNDNFAQDYYAVEHLLNLITDCGGSATVQRNRFMDTLGQIRPLMNLRAIVENQSEFKDILDFNATVDIEGLSDTERELAALINHYRMMLGLHPLRLNAKLCKAAQGHSDNMVKEGFWSHTSPVKGEESAKARILKAGYDFKYEGEVLSDGPGRADQTLQTWFESSGHHRVIIDINRDRLHFEDFGVGSAYDKERDSWMWTANLGIPK